MTSPDGNDALLVRGSLVFDIDFSLAERAPCRLVHFRSDRGWPRGFTIFLNADYSLSVEARQGASRSYAGLGDIDLRDACKLRLTYAWDAPTGSGMLTAECVKGGAIHQAKIANPIPIPMSDASDIVHGAGTVAFDDRVQAIALNNRVVAVGPSPTISQGAIVETTDGPCLIERLRLGDHILTKDNGAQPVRWILAQDLPAMGRTMPIRLKAPHFGLTGDITVTDEQRVLISGIETEYNLGLSAVLVSAGNLSEHAAASRQPGKISTTFYQVLLDNHECIKVSGAWTDSLFVGKLKNSPQVLAMTGLAKVPVSIFPIHRAHARPLLHDYERQALLETLSA